jgi:apolipoprotein N-acyltransferase
MRTNTLAQIRTFVALFLAPEAAAWCVLLAFAARASIVDGLLVLTRGSRRVELAARDVVAVEPWRVPLPGIGVSLRLASGEALASRAGERRARRGGAVVGGGQRRTGAGAPAVAGDEVCAGAPGGAPRAPFAAAAKVRRASSAARHSRVPAAPAHRLRQRLGEYYTFGLAAYLTTFGLWWAAWAIGVVLCAAVLRAGIEVGTLAVLLLRPARAIDARRWLERVGLALLYIGLPAWLLLRIIAP